MSSQRPECNVFVEFEYDHNPGAYDSNLSIRARFPRKQTLTSQQCGDYQNIIFHFFAGSFNDVESDIRVRQVQHLPPHLAGDQRAQESLEKGWLFELTVHYLPHKVTAQGIEGPEHFSNAASHDAAALIRLLSHSRTTVTQLYCLMIGPKPHRDLEALKACLRDQKNGKIYPEYWDMARTEPTYGIFHPTSWDGTFQANFICSIQWGIEGASPDVDRAEKEKTKLFHDEDHHAITLCIGHMREAEAATRAATRALDKPVVASFVAVRGYHTLSQLPSYYAMCIGWEEVDIIRQMLQPGSRGTV